MNLNELYKLQRHTHKNIMIIEKNFKYYANENNKKKTPKYYFKK